MENLQVLERIASLKGRKNYEEKKASKLGFSSLYDYFEDKIIKEQTEIKTKENNLKDLNLKRKNKKKQKSNFVKTCKCC
tara:strand:+ start:317 stop:553 length:237 start_codon:yes stop_codon:yes gene_type:complete